VATMATGFLTIATGATSDVTISSESTAFRWSSWADIRASSTMAIG
jgi:hypothetical protein